MATLRARSLFTALFLLLQGVFACVSFGSFPDTLFTSPLSSENAEVDTALQRIPLNSNASFLAEKHADVPFSNAENALRWQKNKDGDVLNFGFTRNVYWIHAPVNISRKVSQPLLLAIPYPLLEHVEIIAIDSAQNRFLMDSKTSTHAAERFHHFQTLLFPLPAQLRGPVDFYLRVKSTTSMQIPLEIWSEDYTLKQNAGGNLWWGLYFGVVIGLIFYNGFLYFSVRDITYCYYSLYLVASVGVMLCLSGLGNAYLWNNETRIGQQALSFFTSMMSLFMLAFARAFLHWKGFPRHFDQALHGGVYFCLGQLLFAWFNPVQGAHLAAWTGSIALTMTSFFGAYALFAGLQIARFFVLAFMTFAAGASAYLLNVFGLLPVSPLTTHAIQIGSALEAILLSLALAHRIKEDRLAAMRALQQKHDTEQKLKQIQLDTFDAAMHDPLTQMPNDSLLLARLGDWIKNDTLGGNAALVLVRFPQVREVGFSLGRATAEKLFCKLTHSLNSLLAANQVSLCIEERSSAHIVVIEFGLIAFLSRADDVEAKTRSLVDKIRTTYERPFDIDDISINLETYSGIAFYPLHGDRGDILLQHATAALEEAFRNGHRACVYNTEIDAYGQRRLALMGALSHALRKAELEIYAQPQMTCTDGTLAGAEILLRWHSDRLGNVPTQEFIDIAENAGMMKHITRYVMSRSMLFLKQLHQRGMKVTISVNLSVNNLIEPDFVKYVVDSARALSVDLRFLVLEVTETSASENMDQVIDNLNLLAKAGCSIALDDFGTGYSSLSYLSRLPIHELKIDRSFIASMSNSESDLRIVENTVALARTLKIQTVAEGIEDEKMLATVAALGCDRAQGYLLGKPMPVAAFSEWATARS